MKRLAIERKSGLSRESFVHDHLDGSGAPVIITDGITRWPALRKWTFEYFRSVYGSDLVAAPFGLGGDLAKLTKLHSYIDYLDNPEGELPGFWIDGKTGKPLRATPTHITSPAYLLGWDAFRAHPELRDDIQPPPHFVADWVLALNSTLRDVFEKASGREYWSIYIGPRGALSPLHVDYWQTHAYLAQIQGRKRAILFSPDDAKFLYDGQVDPENPDFERFELFDQATAHECEIGPGEMLFIPSNWWHCVRSIGKSITVSHNFFNDTNVNAHLAGFLGDLSAAADGLSRSKETKK